MSIDIAISLPIGIRDTMPPSGVSAGNKPIILKSPRCRLTSAVNKRTVDTFLRHKLLMRALLCYLSTVYNKDIICLMHSF
jgi:hypothetical protein